MIFRAIHSDFKACMDNDPAARGFWGGMEVLFTYAGFHALLLHRIAHVLHTNIHLPFLPRVISQVNRFFTGIEIHPGAKIAHGVFIDHGMGVVIGETAEIGEGCVLFQGVTLGGTGKETGKRHPTLDQNVMVSAGAKVLGNIHLGENVKIGAQAVVLKDVPPNCTVVGVPGRIVIRDGQRVVSATGKRGVDLDHTHLPDPIMERLEQLTKEIEKVQHEIENHHKTLPEIVPTHSASDNADE
ncbi:MAG: serine O-acetyltransferase EpsC [Candidatus Hinthialibacter antarcticus]|nr:serine O-acetyltransferase EpsC [Candidatus Hinthialibacter antarcticus]